MPAAAASVVRLAGTTDRVSNNVLYRTLHAVLGEGSDIKRFCLMMLPWHWKLHTAAAIGSMPQCNNAAMCLAMLVAAAVSFAHPRGCT
jgi:hypothetical protein